MPATATVRGISTTSPSSASSCSAAVAGSVPSASATPSNVPSARSAASASATGAGSASSSGLLQAVTPTTAIVIVLTTTATRRQRMPVTLGRWRTRPGDPHRAATEPSRRSASAALGGLLGLDDLRRALGHDRTGRLKRTLGALGRGLGQGLPQRQRLDEQGGEERDDDERDRDHEHLVQRVGEPH